MCPSIKIGTAHGTKIVVLRRYFELEHLNQGCNVFVHLEPTKIALMMRNGTSFIRTRLIKRAGFYTGFVVLGNALYLDGFR